MNIAEAAKEAMAIGRCITRSDAKGKCKIRPTNEKENCILMGADGSNPSKYGWQPSAKDLVSDIWEVVD